jgi:uncharacterized protein YcfJ
MQKGAAIGAGLGALTGQALGHNTGSTLIGTGVGTLVGAIVGNAIDQRHQALRETPVVHPQAYSYPSRPAATTSYQHSGGAIGPCRTVTERVWEDGRLIRETSREVCDQENAYHTY